MEKFLELIKQRRLWAGLVGVLAFLLTLLKANCQIDVPVLTDLLTTAGGAVASLVTALLALWSYFKPKS
jgi:hypothetical protein